MLREKENRKERLIDKIFDSICSSGAEIYFRSLYNYEEMENMETLYHEEGLICLEILSEDLIQYDKVALGRELSEETIKNSSLIKVPAGEFSHNFRVKYSIDNVVDYSPYFIEFQVPVKEVKQKQEFFRKLDGKWYQGRFVPANDQIKLYDCEFVEGILMTCASPVKYVKKVLVFEDIPEISVDTNFLETSGSQKKLEEIKSELERIFSHASDFKLEVLNVGTGNCIFLTALGKEIKRIYFDIGYGNTCDLQAEYKDDSVKHLSAKRAMNVYLVDAVILSHWDLDHILGCALANEQIYSVPWIAPNLNDKCHEGSINAKRLAKFLESRKKLNLVGSSYSDSDFTKSGLIYEGNCVVIGRGSGKITNTRPRPSTCSEKCTACTMAITAKWPQLTSINNTGISIRILQMSGGENADVILAGDTEYHRWPKCIHNSRKCRYLVVPHHASNMCLDVMPKGNKERAYAIICASGECKKHPCKRHVVKLAKNDYETVITGNCNKSVYIESVKSGGKIKIL